MHGPQFFTSKEIKSQSTVNSQFFWWCDDGKVQVGLNSKNLHPDMHKHLDRYTYTNKSSQEQSASVASYSTTDVYTLFFPQDV